MNRQISELTNLVLALTEKISSDEKSSSNDREGNAPNITTSNELDARSDMVTGVPTTNYLRVSDIFPEPVTRRCH